MCAWLHVTLLQNHVSTDLLTPNLSGAAPQSSLRGVSWALVSEVKSLSRVRLFATPWIRFLCPWDFPGKNYWSELPFPPPGNLPYPGIEPRSPHCRQTLYHLSHSVLSKSPNKTETHSSHTVQFFQ